MKLYLTAILASIILIFSFSSLAVAQSEDFNSNQSMKAKEELPAELGSLKVDNRLIEGLLAAKPVSGKSSEFNQKELIENRVKEMILVEKISDDKGLVLSSEKLEAISSYHDRTLKEIELASKSTNEVERKNAQEVLSMYHSVIEKSGLMQDEYEEFVREEMIYKLRKNELIETTFDGNQSRFDATVKEYKNRYSVIFS